MTAPLPDILALDIATVTGWAWGRPGTKPECGSYKFAATGSSHAAIFAGCFDWLVAVTKAQRPDVIVIEDLLPFGAKRGRTNKSTGDLLGGLHGIVRMVAFKRAIFDFHAVSANDVRGHFIDARGYKRDQAKRYVLRKCHALGWLNGNARDEDAADACAIWSYWCAQVEPLTALKVSPLFNKAVA